jgi:hypothetical protein
MAAKTKANFLIKITPRLVSLSAQKMAKASTHVKQIFMNGRSGRGCCGAVTTSGRYKVSLELAIARGWLVLQGPGPT